MKIVVLFTCLLVLFATVVRATAVPEVITGINFSPSQSQRLAPDWSPVPTFARASFWATGTNYDGFTPPGLLQNVYIDDDYAVLAVDAVNHVYFFNVSNSFYYADDEVSCLGAPGYETYTIYWPNTTKPWTWTDQINGYTQTVQVGKTFGPDLGYTTVSLTRLTIPTVGSTVVLNIPPLLLYNALQEVIVIPSSTQSDFFQGTVVSYIGTELTLKVTLAFGSGTFEVWEVFVAGDLIYGGLGMDLSSCSNPTSNTIITDNHGYAKAWLTYESYNVLGLNYTVYGQAAVDISVSATYFDKIYPGQPPAYLTQRPAGCATGPNFCTANNMLPPFPDYPQYPGPAWVNPYITN